MNLTHWKKSGKPSQASQQIGGGSQSAPSLPVRYLRAGADALGLTTFTKGRALQMGGGWGGRGGSRGSWFYGLLPGAKIDYVAMAGATWKNTVIAAAIGWIGRNIPQAPPAVHRETAGGEEKKVAGHPAARLLRRPNPYYDGGVLKQGIILSLICAGNAYVYIVTDNLGRPKQLWYLPHFLVSPVWDNDATTDNWIKGYIYRQNGQDVFLKSADVIHLRSGINPENPRLGIPDVAFAARGIVTINEADGYDASLMVNLGIPGVIITPKDSESEWDETTADSIKARVEENTQGDNRFRPMVLDGSVDVKPLGLKPSELQMETIRDEPTATLCMLIGINPVVLGAKVGLEHSTYSNLESAEKHAWTNGIIPRLGIIDEAMTVQLLPMYGDDPDVMRIGSDLTRVPALAENQDLLFKRVGDATGGPFLTVNEGRQRLGLQAIKGGDFIYPAKTMPQVPVLGDDAKSSLEDLAKLPLPAPPTPGDPNADDPPDPTDDPPDPDKPPKPKPGKP